MAQSNWRPAEDMGYHDQGRPGTALRPRTMEKGLGESVYYELAQDRRAWSASVRDVVNAIGDAGASTSK